MPQITDPLTLSYYRILCDYIAYGTKEEVSEFLTLSSKNPRISILTVLQGWEGTRGIRLLV